MNKYVKGLYKRAIFTSNTGYIIGLFKVIDTNDDSLEEYINKTITFTGYFHELNEIDTYMLYGQLINHPKYGVQYQVSSYDRVKPEGNDAIIEFLTSGLFKGIGEKKAQKIVDALGSDTFNTILEKPDDLILIPTITKNNSVELHNKLKEYENSYTTIIYLNELGLNTKDSMIIYNKYKESTKLIIEDNIYSLVDNIHHLTFKKIDKIALDMGVEKDALIRIEASIIYIMGELSNLYGHSYFYMDELKIVINKLLQVHTSDDMIDHAFKNLVNDLKIIKKEDKYYLKEMYDAETLSVKRLRLLQANDMLNIKNFDQELEKLEFNLNITYNEEQKEAIRMAICNKLSIITGGPGTGKTTILRAITELYMQIKKYNYEKMIDKVALLSPTGRAAKRMSEQTNLPAYTIHRFLKWQKDSNKFQVNEYNKSDVELIIVDEVSMIDTYLFANLLKGISANCTIIMVGDHQQLPSVGPGNLLSDLILSDKLNVVTLKKLYRQKETSNILSLSYDIRDDNLNYDVFNHDPDLTIIECLEKDVINHIMEISTNYKDLSYKEFQILSPMYKTLNGIDNINTNIQNIFNPKNKLNKEITIGEVTFREGDKVIQLTNMPEDNVYNGDIGIISKISPLNKKEVHIKFDSGEVKYTPSTFHNFRLAYATSIHKAQGSEFDVVIIPIVKSFNKMLYKKLIYTGVTRSKKKLYLVGDYKALELAVSNKDIDLRRTTIKDFLVDGIK